MSVRWFAESFTRLTCVMNTTFREKIYSRWCCIDRLSRHRLSGPIAVKLTGTHMNAVCCQGRSQIWFCPDWLEGKLVDRRAIALVVPLRGCSVDCVRDRILRPDGQSARDMRSEAGAQIMLHHPLSRREAVCFCSGVCTPAERVHELVQPS